MSKQGGIKAMSNLNRRDFLAAAGLTCGVATLPWFGTAAAQTAPPPRKKQGAIVRTVFLYPPSETFSSNPNGWWSWPGNEFDAERRQKEYMAALANMEKRLGMTLVAKNSSVANSADAQKVAQELEASRPDGLLLIMFYNNSLAQANLLVQAAEKLDIPVIFFIGLGVKHGAITPYRRPGIYFIQSLDNLDAIEYGARMINARKHMRQSLLLSITEADKPREGTESFLGIKVRVIPFAHYAERFHKVEITEAAQNLMRKLTRGATEVRGVTEESLRNAMRAHLALTGLLQDENADGLTMNCLRRGMLKPCISFSLLNGMLTPAACENDSPAVYTQLLGQLLVGRPGFQHNPCYETEKNHYYASHCTCPTKVYGPDGPELTYLLRRFAHTNEGSCAIQAFWKPGDPVTMMRYYPGEKPALDVYAGRVVVSHPMPPAGGCTTNVEVEITDRSDACLVKGHHNLLFCGDFARQFRLFAQLYKMRLADTGYQGPPFV
jgi:L-fucose isomerase-like protein